VLQTRLGAALNALRRDADGDPVLVGSRGLIRATNGLFTAHVFGGSRRHWAMAKRLLESFATVTSDCGDGGTIRLDRLPDGEPECGNTRHAVGIRATKPASAADHLHREAKA
jgi:hypothetical protein